MISARLTVAWLAFAACISGAGAQTWVEDPNFHPAVVNDFLGQGLTFTPAADGRWLAVGGFTHLGPERFATSGVAYLGADGAVDHRFASTKADVSSAVSRGDGSVIGVALTGGGWEMEPQSVLFRLGADGSADPAFPALSVAGAMELTPLPDGGIAARHNTVVRMYGNNPGLLRLNADGTRDQSFAAELPKATTDVLAVAGQPDGKLVVSVDVGTSGQLIRLTRAGALDPTFANGSTTNRIHALAVAADGKIVYADGGIGRFNADGTADLSFHPVRGYAGRSAKIVVLADNTIVSDFDYGVAVLNADGSLRSRVGAGSSSGPWFSLAGVTADRILTVERALADGYVTGWRLVPFTFTGASGTPVDLNPRNRVPGYVSSMAADAESRLVAVGHFNEIDGRAVPGVARFTSAGVLDPTFAPVLPSTDGTIVVIADNGAFLYADPRYGGSSWVVHRVTSDGAVDPTFTPPAEISGYHAMTADGRVLASRFSPDSSRDENFQLVWLAPNGAIERVLPTRFAGVASAGVFPSAPLAFAKPMADGGILVGGQFSGVNGQARPWVARLDAAGMLNPAYAADLPAFDHPTILPPDARNRVVLAGSSGNDSCPLAVRIRAEGTLDPAFYSIPSFPSDVTPLQENGLPDVYLPRTAIAAPDGTRWTSSPLRHYRPVDVLTAETRVVSGFAAAGAPVTFYSPVGTREAVSYQWLHDGVEIPGATLAVLSLPAARASDAGAYQTRVSDGGAAITTAPVMLTVAGGKGRLVNVSCLASAADSTGPTLGFVVGSDGATRPWLVRGMSRGLRVFGISDVLPLVDLSLFGRGALVGHDVGSATQYDIAAAGAKVGAFPPFISPYGGLFPSPAEADSALLQPLTSGSYTARALARPGEKGTVLLEVYDTQPGGASGGLVNGSARLLLRPDQPTVRMGLALAGPAPARVLIRGVGPGLGAFGLTSVADPVLTVYRTTGERLASNAGWADDPAIGEAGRQAHAFTLTPGSRDAALLVRLEAGTYTVELQSETGKTGEALIEVYCVD